MSRIPALPRLLDERDLPRIPQQVRSRTKRDALLAAALTLFGSRGYEAVSIEDIVDCAKTGVGTFYAYFRSKTQLLLVLMQRYLETMLALDLLTEMSGRSPSEAIATSVYRAFVPDRAYAGLWRAWREAVVVESELGDLDREIRGWMDDYVVLLIDQAATLGPLRPDLDRQAMATVLNGLLLQLSQYPLEHSKAVLDATVKMIYHALFCDQD